MFRHVRNVTLLVVLGTLAFLWLVKAPILSVYLNNKLGLSTTVRFVSIWPSKTKIKYFKIKNPVGYRPKSAFEAEEIEIEYRWGAITSDPRVIDLIVLKDVTLNIDIKNPTASNNNWAAIGAGIPKTQRKSRAVLIKKLRVENMVVNVTGVGAKILGVSGKKRFEKLEFENLDSKNGFPTKQVISEIFKGAGVFNYLERFLNPTERIKEALNPFNLFGKTPQGESPER